MENDALRQPVLWRTERLAQITQTWRRQASVIWLILALTRCQNVYSTFLCLRLTNIASGKTDAVYSIIVALQMLYFCGILFALDYIGRTGNITQNDKHSKFGFVGTHGIFPENKPAIKTEQTNSENTRSLSKSHFSVKRVLRFLRRFRKYPKAWFQNRASN